MAFRPLVAIGDFEFPEPSTYEANTADIVDSARNVEGRVVGAVIRSDVAKATISWRYLTAEQWAEILKQFRSSAGGAFYNNVTFYNQSSGDWETRLMYVSDRTSGMWRRDPMNGDIMGWTNCKLSLVEV